MVDDEPVSSLAGRAMILMRGQTVVRRYFERGLLTATRLYRVVHHDIRGLMLWLPRGAPGEHRATNTVSNAATAFRRTTAERDELTLIRQPNSAPAVSWFFREEAFSFGRVCLSQENALWATNDMQGIDTVDDGATINFTPDHTGRWHGGETGQVAVLRTSPQSALREEWCRLQRDVASGRFQFDENCQESYPPLSRDKMFLPAGSWRTHPCVIAARPTIGAAPAGLAA